MTRKKIKNDGIINKIPSELENSLFVAISDSGIINKDYSIKFDSHYIGNYKKLQELAFKILEHEKPDSDFENRLIQEIDSAERLEYSDAMEEYQFKNLKHFITEHNLLMIMLIINSALNCRVVGLEQFTNFEL
jgi:hypothetical protein